MKKIFLIMCLLLTITGCEKEEKIKEDNAPKIDYKIDTLEKPNCDSSVEKYYSDDTLSIYLVCLSDITLLEKNMSLKSYIESGITATEATFYLSNQLVLHASLLDGGTAIYRDTGPVTHTKNGLTLIKCNTTEGVKDVYIGKNDLDEDWGFSNGFCGHYITNDEIE